MSRFARLLPALIIIWAASAQRPGSETRPDDYVLRAKQFLRIFYPGLDRNLTAVIIDGNRLGEPGPEYPGTMSNFTVELHDMRPSPGKDAPGCWCSSPRFLASFAFDWRTEKKELVNMAAGGLFVDSNSNKFLEDMRKHPEWSYAEASAALTHAGAKFGPEHKDEFRRALPILDLKQFVGELEVTSVDFHFWNQSGTGGNTPISPSWSVQAKWRPSNGAEGHCMLLFEPFDGRLMSLLVLHH